jgi:hypothetical protein
VFIPALRKHMFDTEFTLALRQQAVRKAPVAE